MLDSVAPLRNCDKTSSQHESATKYGAYCMWVEMTAGHLLLKQLQEIIYKPWFLCSCLLCMCRKWRYEAQRLHLHHAKVDYTFPDLVLIITVVLITQTNHNKVIMICYFFLWFATVNCLTKCREYLCYFLEIE